MDSVPKIPDGIFFTLQPCLVLQFILWLEDIFLGLSPVSAQASFLSSTLFLTGNSHQIAKSSGYSTVHPFLPSRHVLIYLASSLPETILVLETSTISISKLRAAPGKDIPLQEEPSEFISFRRTQQILCHYSFYMDFLHAASRPA